MSESLKISGKKFPVLPSMESAKQEWIFTHRPGGWVIAQSSTGIRKRFAIREVRGKLSAHLSGYLWFGEWIKKERKLSAQAGDADLVAQFPGKVRKVLVQKGSEVKENDPLLLVEAMKMEFSVRAPYDGKVAQVFVKEGQQLSPGDRFLDLENKTNG